MDSQQPNYSKKNIHFTLKLSESKDPADDLAIYEKFLSMDEDCPQTQSQEVSASQGEVQIQPPSPVIERKGTFETFIIDLKNQNIEPLVTWNKEREYFIKEKQNKRKVVLKEISQFECHNPLDILDDAYKKEKYDTNLLVNQVKDLEHIMTEKSYLSLISKQERLEMTKKIIDYYLNYIVELNFDSIMRALKKLTLIETNLDLCYQRTIKCSKNIKSIKTHFLISSSRIALLKQKLKNLLRIHQFIKELLEKWVNTLKQCKILKSSLQFAQLYLQLISLQDEIVLWNKNKPLTSKRNLFISEILNDKCKRKLGKLQKRFENEMNSIFIERKENLFELFHLYSLAVSQNGEMCEESLNGFVQVLFSTFKKTIFNIIKGTLTAFTEENRSYLVQDIKKIRELCKLKYDETKLTQGFHQLFKNFIKVSLCFNTYITQNLDEKMSFWKEKLFTRMFEMRMMFCEYLEKKTAKIFSCFSGMIRDFSMKRNFICVVAYLCMFSEILKHDFKVECFKYLSNSVVSLVHDQIKNETIRNLKKIGILLAGDNWKRVAIQDEHDFFAQAKLEEKCPLVLKNYLSLFNDSSFVSRSTLKDIFSKSLEDISHFFFSNSSANNLNVKLLSKPLDNKKLILGSSAITLIKSLLDLVTDLVFFDNCTYEIFIQIFNIFDYFILASVYMFMLDKRYFNQLFEEINIEDLKKKGKFELGSDIAILQNKYKNLRNFFISTKKHLEVLFQNEIDFVNKTYDGGENFEVSDFHLPKLNSQILISENNVYSCMIESIILIESICSVYQVIKRLTHFAVKIPPENQDVIVKSVKQYKIILKELQVFIYHPICWNIFKIDPLLNKLIAFKWDPKDNEADNQFSDASPFVYNLLEEIFEKFEKLNILSGGSLTEMAQVRFLDVIVLHINERIVDSMSRVRKCNSIGRSIMLKDIKFLKSKIEDKLNKERDDGKITLNLDSYFNDLVTYINSWYFNEEELLMYIIDNNVNYKYILGIVATGLNFSKMSKQQKRDYIMRIEEQYYLLIENIKQKLTDY